MLAIIGLWMHGVMIQAICENTPKEVKKPAKKVHYTEPKKEISYGIVLLIVSFFAIVLMIFLAILVCVFGIELLGLFLMGIMFLSLVFGCILFFMLCDM